MAFVVLQHLSPDFKTMMLELLGRDTTMKIHRAEDGMVVEANSRYLLPPKKEMVIGDGRLHVTDKDRSKRLALPINHFLESLARECGSQAVAIILLGSGSDGSRGVIEIARHGGFVISESPKTAKFDGMPSSAQASGVVDEILVPEDIGALLVRIATEQTLTRNERIVREKKRQDSLHGMESIYQLFRRVHDIDFSVYKDTTVLRRIDRRLKMVGAASLDDYARRLHDMPGELDALYGDLLIGVTQFFRDSETYGILNRTIFPGLVAKCDPARTLRVWAFGRVRCRSKRQRCPVNWTPCGITFDNWKSTFVNLAKTCRPRSRNSKPATKMRATNEESIASNEELQSTNEESHSVNEELCTVNSEHQHKISELAELNQDRNHSLDNTDVATVFLDRDLCVRRFTTSSSGRTIRRPSRQD